MKAPMKKPMKKSVKKSAPMAKKKMPSVMIMIGKPKMKMKGKEKGEMC